MSSPTDYFEPNETPATLTTPTTPATLTELTNTSQVLPPRQQWYYAFKQILPPYIFTHILFLILTYLTTLFSVANFSHNSLNIAQLLHFWDRWDTEQFVAIATKGYDAPWRTAFFPLFPLLEKGVSFLTQDTFIAGLLISNLAGLGVFVVLYRLVLEDFDAGRASRAVLYLAIFPTAFFFAAAYNESLFLFLSLLSFYHIRRGHWWLAGFFGFLASLTRSAGLLLLVPFLYEYLRQRMDMNIDISKARFTINLRKLRFNILAGLGMPAGLGVFALYCYMRFHDALAFSHAQSVWTRTPHGPWHGLIDAFGIITRSNILSFDSIHNVIDLSTGLIMLLLVVLCFVGPWKFAKELWVYAIYAAAIYLLLMFFPAEGGYPLQSLSRLVLELFPAFIVLAAIGKKEQFHLYYLLFSVSLLSFLLLQFLTGRWTV